MTLADWTDDALAKAELELRDLRGDELSSLSRAYNRFAQGAVYEVVLTAVQKEIQDRETSKKYHVRTGKQNG